MTWRDAFLRQARSDYAMWRLLNRQLAPLCHQLHLLQMATEKLAKAHLAGSDSASPPEPTHRAFVRFLQVVMGQPHLRRLLGFDNQMKEFRRFVRSLLPLAERIERLAPSSATLQTPNAEYPWLDGATGQVIAPVDFDFPDLTPTSPQMKKLVKLIDDLFQIGV